MKKKKKAPKKVAIAKGVKISKKKASERRKKPGQSNLGKYPDVKPKDFAGPDGTFPINSLARAKSAIKLAHNAANPEAIKRKVYKKWPQLKPKKKD